MTGTIQKNKKRIIMILSAVLLIILSAVLIWWVSPVHFLERVAPEDVAVIQVMNKNNGNRFNITYVSDISYITENIRKTEMKKDKIGYTLGTYYNLAFISKEGKSIDSFIINSGNTIRDGIIFYRCDNELNAVVDCLKQMEQRYLSA